MAKKEKKKTAKKEIKNETPVEISQEEDEAKEIHAIERVMEDRNVLPHDTFGKLNRSQIELIKRTIAKGSTDDELKLFIQVCKGNQLNPFLRQVHLVKRWDSRLGKDVATIQVGIDGFRSIAESSGTYAGNDDAVYEGETEVQTKDKKIIAPAKATVTVYKVVEGQRYGFTATARWSEYYPGEKIGFQWHKMPYLMLGKCAEALALRKAFPKLLSGMYVQEEMDQSKEEERKGAVEQNKFETLKNVISRMKEKDLAEAKEKMEKSDKYTKEQKAEFIGMVNKRIEEITEIKKKENVRNDS
jgi:phage recombination protein Bet